MTNGGETPNVSQSQSPVMNQEVQRMISVPVLTRRSPVGCAGTGACCWRDQLCPGQHSAMSTGGLPLLGRSRLTLFLLTLLPLEPKKDLIH